MAVAARASIEYESRDWPEVVYNVDPDPERHISPDCVPAIRAIREFQACRKVKVTKLHGSFSGALVLLAKPFDAHERELPSSVLKYDKHEAVMDEAEKTEEHGKAFGATYPRVRDIQVIGEWAVMQIDLCGGCWACRG
jgi:hypothetical protein